MLQYLVLSVLLSSLIQGQTLPTYDYIVIGAGTAGCPLVSRLLDNGFTVLLVEDGPSFPPLYSQRWFDTTSPKAFPSWDERYTAFSYPSEPDTLGNRQRILHGRGVGGSTIINGGLYSRPDSSDFDDWNIPGWSAADLLPYFVEQEKLLAPGFGNGHMGPLPIRECQAQTNRDLVAQMLQATEVLSEYPAQNGTLPRNSFTLAGGVEDATLHKFNSYQAFIAPELSDPNLTLSSNTRATRIYAQPGASGNLVATEVSLITNGLRRWVARATKEIIISAGVFETPKLLLLSGIGNPDDFSQFAIPTLANITNVGQNLVARPLQLVGYTGVTLLPEQDYQSATDPIASEQFINGLGGYFSYPVASITGFGATLSQTKNDWMFEFTDTQPLFDVPIPTAQGFACIVTNVTSLGTVKIRSPNPFDLPKVSPNFYSTQNDIDIMVGCMQTFRGIVAGFNAATNGGASAFLGEEFIPGPTLQSNEDVAEYIYTSSTYSYHAYGTSKMGNSPDNSVVDPTLRVHGFDNLRIADGSIIPGYIGSGPMATIYAIGGRAADLILEADYTVSLATSYDVCPTDYLRLVRTAFNGTQAATVCAELGFTFYDVDGDTLTCAPRDAPSLLKNCGVQKAFVFSDVSSGCNVLTISGTILRNADCSAQYPVLCSTESLIG